MIILLKRSLYSQVYKATGEEFLKIAGGQISGIFFSLSSPHSMFAWRRVVKGFLFS